MANWDILKSAIAGIIKTNSNQEITGQLLQNVLNNIVSSVGENATFAGIATPTTNPGAPDGPVFYLATQAGAYANFNGIELLEGEAVILQWNNGSWLKKVSGFATQEQLKELDKRQLIASSYGKGSNWAQIFMPIFQDIAYSVCLTGDITDATIEGQSTFVQIGIEDLTGKVTAYPFILPAGQKFVSGTVVSLASYRGKISRVFIEGRWHQDEKLTVSIVPDVHIDDIVSLNSKTKALSDSLSFDRRSTMRVWHSGGSINFNNKETRVEISAHLYSFSPVDGSDIIIEPGNIPYSFSLSNSSLVYLCYNCETKAVVFSYRHLLNYPLVPIVAFTAVSNTTCSSITWSAIDDTRIDGNVGGTIENIKAIKNEIIERIGPAEKALSLTQGVKLSVVPTGVGTIYNGTAGGDAVCLYDSQYYDTEKIKSVSINSKEGLLFRVNEYDADKKFIKQSEYTTIQSYILHSNTMYIRFSVSYKNFGYSASNPITLSAYSEGDFVVLCDKFLAFEKLLGDAALSKNSKIGNGSSWATFRLNFDVIKAGTPFVLEFSGKLTSQAMDGQTFLAWMATDISGKDTYLRIIQGKDAASYEEGAKFYYELDYDIQGIAVEGRWLNSETLTASVYVGVNVEIESLKNEIKSKKVQGIIERNMHKDAMVRSTGIKVISNEIRPLSFIHMSDAHTKSDNYGCLANACAYLEHYGNIKFAIITGDIVWDTFADKMDWYDIAVQNTTKPVLNVIGNHDSGQNMGETSLEKVSTDLECYNKYIAPYVKNWGVTQPTNASVEGKSYYYKDFTEEKIRLIVLCEFETDYEINPNDPTQLLYSREFRAMRQSQVDWLIGCLLATPSDYGVIVALHQPDTLNDEDNAFVSFRLVNRQIANVYADDKEWLLKILDAYQKNKAISFSFNQTGAVVGTINVNCDFTNISSELICVICGHTHDDYIGHYKSYPDMRVLVAGANNLMYTGVVCQRQAGTPSEDMFNVVNVDRNRRKISVIRVGADGSAYGQYRNHIILDY